MAKLPERLVIFKNEVSIKSIRRVHFLEGAYLNEDEISRYIEAQELRNSMDILVRKIIEALYNKDIDNLKAYLCDNATIDEEKIVFQIDDSQNEAEYLSREVRIDKLRQRYYYMDKDEKYIRGYEIIDPKFENTFVMVLTFVNKNGEWQLFDLENDA